MTLPQDIRSLIWMTEWGGAARCMVNRLSLSRTLGRAIALPPTISHIVLLGLYFKALKT